MLHFSVLFEFEILEMDGRIKINTRKGGGKKPPKSQKTIVNRENNDAGGDRKKIFTGQKARSYDRRETEDTRRYDEEKIPLQREYTSRIGIDEKSRFCPFSCKGGIKSTSRLWYD